MIIIEHASGQTRLKIYKEREDKTIESHIIELEPNQVRYLWWNTCKIIWEHYDIGLSK